MGKSKKPKKSSEKGNEKLYLSGAGVRNLQLQTLNAFDNKRFDVRCEGTLEECILELNKMIDRCGGVPEHQIVSIVSRAYTPLTVGRLTQCDY
jgi:hypothetical protein